jgi:DNA polymerase
MDNNLREEYKELIRDSRERLIWNKVLGITHLPLEDSKELLLDLIYKEVKECDACALSKTRTNAVFGKGNPRARLCFIGEAPGYEEDQVGLPFVGQAGKLLDRIIAAMKLKPDEVYISNIVKCRPPQNRTPFFSEIKTCQSFVERQLEIIKPKIIVALGKCAIYALLNKNEPLSLLRGKFYRYKSILVMPTYHPAHLLRWPEKKKETWQDMKKVMEFLKGFKE